MSEDFNNLRAMSMDELIFKYDQLAKHTQVGTNHYYDEINRRYNEQSAKVIVKLTKWITIMTFVMTIATIINIFIAYYD